MCMATRPITRGWWWPTLWVGPGGGHPSKNIKYQFKNKTTFVWRSAWQYHPVWGGGGSPKPYGLQELRILPPLQTKWYYHRLPDSGSFVIIIIVNLVLYIKIIQTKSPVHMWYSNAC